ncbi:hypothetical protein [Larkinella ripae]
MLALAALAFTLVLVSVVTSGILSVICALIAAGLGVCAGYVQAAVLVDENYQVIPNTETAPSAAKTPHLMPETTVSKY